MSRIKYDISQFTPMDREEILRTLHFGQIPHLFDSGWLLIDKNDEHRVDVILGSLGDVAPIDQPAEESVIPLALQRAYPRMYLPGVTGDQERHGIGSGTAVCRVCGGQNAQWFTFKRGVGRLVQRSVYVVEGNFCKACALSIGRDSQSKTLLTGWWGVISMVTNVGYIWNNSVNLNRANRMNGPVNSGGIWDESDNLSVFRRPVTWVGIGIIVGLILWGYVDQKSSVDASGLAARVLGSGTPISL